MNKITKEIANILESQINKETYEIQNNGLSAQQQEEIAQFIKMFSKNGLLPFPLKMR
ncbi:hypothetical protein [Candidatus Nitrosocosmicus franklandus]|nr:hypothetical protein [Candidatus Nitrosocosmicus franklandus]